MRQTRLDINVAKRLEAEFGVERRDVLLGVQQHWLCAVEPHDLIDEYLGEPFTPAVRAHDDPPEQRVSVAVAGHLIPKDSKVGGSTAVVGDPQVLSCRLEITIIEFFFIDALLDKEDIGAQLE